jgi:hypothetical protein
MRPTRGYATPRSVAIHWDTANGTASRRHRQFRDTQNVAPRRRRPFRVPKRRAFRLPLLGRSRSRAWQPGWGLNPVAHWPHLRQSAPATRLMYSRPLPESGRVTKNKAWGGRRALLHTRTATDAATTRRNKSGPHLSGQNAPPFQFPTSPPKTCIQRPTPYFHDSGRLSPKPR